MDMYLVCEGGLVQFRRGTRAAVARHAEEIRTGVFDYMVEEPDEIITEEMHREILAMAVIH